MIYTESERESEACIFITRSLCRARARRLRTGRTVNCRVFLYSTRLIILYFIIFFYACPRSTCFSSVFFPHVQRQQRQQQPIVGDHFITSNRYVRVVRYLSATTASIPTRTMYTFVYVYIVPIRKHRVRFIRDVTCARAPTR